MTDQDKVRSVVARFFNVSEAAVTDNFVFPPERLHGSVGRATFYAAIKRMAGVELPGAFNAKTFAGLFLPVDVPANSASPAKPESAVPTPATPAGTSSILGLSVGIDVEHSENLSAASDFWAEPFYLENFTSAEIAYCQRQPNPRESFCGLWCAKEAAMKCGTEFLNRRPLELEIMHDTQGRPILTILRDGKPAARRDCDLSISHSHGVSVAVVIAGVGGPQVAISGNVPNVDPNPRGSGNNTLAWLALGLGILNLVLWLLLAMKK